MGRTFGYEEVLALEFFKRTIHDYENRRIDADVFEPFIRNLADDTVISNLCDQLLPGMKEKKNTKEQDECDDFFDNYEDNSIKVACAHLWSNTATREKFREKVLVITDGLLEKLRIQTANDPLRGRIEELKNTLHLDENELNVVLVLWLLNTGRLETIDSIFMCERTMGFIGLCAGMSEKEVRAVFCESSRLHRYGVIDSNDNELNPQIRYFLDGIIEEPLVSTFYKKDTEEVLPVEFFGDLAKKHLPTLKKLIMAKRKRGLNILLYGVPGTGKTSFARALAKVTGRKCYQVVQRPKGPNGEFMVAKAEVRYAAVEICNEQTVPEESLIIVDEADVLLRCTNMGIFEMFGRSSSVTGDKGLLNDILEKNKAPTIWITNTDADELDLSNRRRFDYSIRFNPLTKEQRAGIWKNAMIKAGVPKLLTKKDIIRLIDRYPLNIGIVARALENVASIDAPRAERKAMFEALLDRQCELSGIDERATDLPKVTKDYTLEGLNIKTKIPLEKVIGAARRFLDAKTASNDKDAPRLNILLSGVPGSGKTEFVKYLASQLGRPLSVHRPSDLKSKWVGETEQNIAEAFREAREKKAVLFFDEIDTFLDNREAVAQGHEKSMINEVLQQMENFGGIFVGTTNFVGMLDPAVARRFTFKIELDYLTIEGKRHFFKTFFDTKLTADEEAQLDKIEYLTPGDFRTVRQELYYLGDEVNNADRLTALKEEVLAKTAGRSANIGF